MRLSLNQRPLAVLWAILALLCAAPAWALPQAKQVVHLSGAELRPGSRRNAPWTLVVGVTVVHGWHINSDHPLGPYYIPTHLSVSPPPDLKLSHITYPPAEIIVPSFSKGEKLAVFSGNLQFAATMAALGDGPFPGSPQDFDVKLDYQACNDLQCLPPTSVKAHFQLPAAAYFPAPPTVASQTQAAPALAASRVFALHGLWLGFLLVFLGGIALNLTPCVYPLIGVTIAYFGNQGGRGTRGGLVLAILYTAGICLTFSAVGTAAALSGGLFGALLEQPLVLATLAAVMLLLAASSFGWFSLQPPAWMMRRVAVARPGMVGALLMGLGMGVVAAPCIGPFVLGLLVLVEQRGSALFGLAVFFVLALGLGLPYIALALAAGSIRKLPRSGEWLAWVEHLFGFILIGLAIYFLAPLIPGYNLVGLLPYYGVAVGIYLGLISPIGRQLPAFRLLKLTIGIVSLIALLYLVRFSHRASHLEFAAYSPGLLSAASARHEPAIVDFSADWCVPCREMERTTFTDPSVLHEARRFAVFRADLTHSDGATDALIKQFSIEGVPTVVLINRQGRITQTLVGYTGPRDFLQSLKAIN
jgi:thiol:disulfide interchange protein DsbD